MKFLVNIFESSVGKKFIMAVSGFILFLFIVGHLMGNLQIFLGPDKINSYGAFLHSNLEILWPVRIVLIVMVLLHIWSAAKLSRENKAARPVAYAQYRPVSASYASRTMLMSGLIVLAFIIYHLLDYTVMVRSVNLTGQNFAAFTDAQGRHDVFKMLVVGFHNGWVSAFYILSLALLCLHLSHGLSSMFQSLGWRNEFYRPFLDTCAKVIAWLIFLGYVSIPVAILLGYGKEALK